MRLELNKGADFNLSFRLREDGAIVDLSAATIVFTASYLGTEVFSESSADSPAVITVADDIATMSIPADDTDITPYQLNYQVDVTIDGAVKRWLKGEIICYDSV